MNTAASPTKSHSTSLDTKNNTSNKLPKQKVKEKALEAFLRAGSYGFYQIPAYKIFQVTCLHTYISNFEKQGIKFARKGFHTLILEVVRLHLRGTGLLMKMPIRRP